MARHAQPREIAELKGADRKNPQRYRGEVPKSGLPIGNAPDHLSDGAKKCWFELETYASPGVLTGSDRIALELASVLLAKQRRWIEPPEGIAVEEIWKFMAFSNGELNALVGLLARLGMTPSDRQKFGIGDKDKENSFDEF
jgi:hypothetical protein